LLGSVPLKSLAKDFGAAIAEPLAAKIATAEHAVSSAGVDFPPRKFIVSPPSSVAVRNSLSSMDRNGEARAPLARFPAREDSRIAPSAYAGLLQRMTSVAGHGLRGRIEIGANKVAPVFRNEARCERGRTDEIAEHDRDRPKSVARLPSEVDRLRPVRILSRPPVLPP
jgi:hypothetical protein